MRHRLFLLLLCGLFLVPTLSAQEAQKEKKVLKNADILSMVLNHFDDETLIAAIEASDTDFDISGDTLIDMKKQGVSSAVLRAMIQATQRKRRAATAASAPPANPASTAQPQEATAPPTAAAPAAPANPPAASAPAPSAPPAAPPAAAPVHPVTSAPAMIVPGRGMNSSGMNSQQMAAMQAQLGSMGMGGMFGGMFSMSAYTPEQMPHVFLMPGMNGGSNPGGNKEKQEVSPSTAQIAQSNYKAGGVSPGGMMLRSLATEGLSFAAMGAGPAGMMAMSAFSMASGVMPGMRPGVPSTTYVWGLPGRKSSREFTNLTPMFQLNYGDIPGVDPDAFEPVIIKLFQTKDNYRLVGATQMKMNTRTMMSGGGPENGKWISEERWPTRVDKEERGFYILHVDQPFEPGEYAVVLRPVKGYKATPSGFGGGAQVFYSVWDFSVPGTPAEDNGKKKKK